MRQSLLGISPASAPLIPRPEPLAFDSRPLILGPRLPFTAFGNSPGGVEGLLDRRLLAARAAVGRLDAELRRSGDGGPQTTPRENGDERACKPGESVHPASVDARASIA